MTATQILYPAITIFAIYFIFLSYRNNFKYKKENMKPLLYLNYDDKTRHFMSTSVIVFIIFLAIFLFVGMISTKTFEPESLFTIVLLPLLMVILYIPLTKKTMISTLGIHKRGTLIRWENIKTFTYLKPNEKKQVKAKIIHLFAGRDASIDIAFDKDDKQFEAFKEVVKENRNTKKKEKKSGK